MMIALPVSQSPRACLSALPCCLSALPCCLSALTCCQMRELLSKYMHVHWRPPSYNSVRLFICTFMGLVYGCVYFGSASLAGGLRLANVQNVMGIMYSSTNYLGMINLMAVLPIAVGERVVFYRCVGRGGAGVGWVGAGWCCRAGAGLWLHLAGVDSAGHTNGSAATWPILRGCGL